MWYSLPAGFVYNGRIPSKGAIFYGEKHQFNFPQDYKRIQHSKNENTQCLTRLKPLHIIGNGSKRQERMAAQGALRLQEKLDQIKKQLHAEQFKLTPQREATLRVLLENEESHLSAEEIFMLVKQKAPDIGLATVYRTLDLLCELKIIEKLNFGDGVARYEFRSDDHPHHHHHLICLKCGSLSEIEDLLDDLEARVERDHDFKIVDHRVTSWDTVPTAVSKCDEQVVQPLPDLHFFARKILRGLKELADAA